MGWQLFPTGIGWRSFDRTVEEGTFRCPNVRCGPGSDPPQRYRLRSGRNWVTILFIPVIPLNRTGSYVQCRKCKSALPVSVLDRTVPPLAADRGDPEVVYDLGDWSQPEVEKLQNQLVERDVSFLMESSTELAVDKRHEALVDALVVEITGSPSRPANSADREIVYATGTWSSQQLAEISAELSRDGVAFHFDDGALVVDQVHEATVDELVERVTGETVTSAE